MRPRRIPVDTGTWAGHELELQGECILGPAGIGLGRPPCEKLRKFAPLHLVEPFVITLVIDGLAC